jgi:hypothetical protein
LPLSVYEREEHDRTLAQLPREASDPIKERLGFGVDNAKALQLLNAFSFVRRDSHLILIRSRARAVATISRGFIGTMLTFLNYSGLSER